jgi:hypothetical protein
VRRTHPGVLPPDEHDGPEEEKGAAHDLQQEARQELPEPEDVAVDALDELPRGVATVEGEVEPEDVGGEVLPQAVGRAPGEPRPGPGGPDPDALAGEGDGEIGGGGADEDREGRPRGGLVDETAEELRSEEGQRGGGQQPHDDDGEGATVRPEVGAQERGVVGNGHDDRPTLPTAPAGPQRIRRDQLRVPTR